VTAAAVVVGAGSPAVCGAPLSLHAATNKTASTIHFALDRLSALGKTLVGNVSILAFLRGGEFRETSDSSSFLRLTREWPENGRRGSSAKTARRRRLFPIRFRQ
jgi:hypothetical protein